MWRYVVSKIINWWYWLAIFGFIFVAGQNVHATNYLQNFDTCTVGQTASQCTSGFMYDVQGTCTNFCQYGTNATSSVSTYDFISPPNSLNMDAYGRANLKIDIASSTLVAVRLRAQLIDNAGAFNFWLNTKNNTPTNKRIIEIANTGATRNDVYLTYFTDETHSFSTKMCTEINNFKFIYVLYDPLNCKAYVNCGDSLASDFSATSSSVTLTGTACGLNTKGTVNYLEFYDNFSYTNNWYIDDFQLSYAYVTTQAQSSSTLPTFLDTPVDIPNSNGENNNSEIASITFLNPTDNFPLNIYNYTAPITSPNYFDWNVDYKMSASIINNFPSDIPQILIQYVNASSSIVNTVTMANTNLSFSFYTPGETYNVTSNDIVDFPTQTGIYTAEVDLWRTHLSGGQRYYDDILASSTIQFIIATSTPITGNTAWCSDLCADLDLGTATTSSFWSGLVPNLLNNGICAIRYGACYLFWPDSTVIAQLSNTYDNFKISFPFNVYYDLASTTQNALATSTNMTGTFKMPFITTSGEATTITILSSSSVPNLIGQTNSNLFRTTMGYLIWLITAGGIAFMAFTIL